MSASQPLKVISSRASGFEIRSVVAEHVFHLVSAKHPALQSSPVRDRSPVDVRRYRPDSTVDVGAPLILLACRGFHIASSPEDRFFNRSPNTAQGIPELVDHPGSPVCSYSAYVVMPLGVNPEALVGDPVALVLAGHVPERGHARIVRPRLSMGASPKRTPNSLAPTPSSGRGHSPASTTGAWHARRTPRSHTLAPCRRRL